MLLVPHMDHLHLSRSYLRGSIRVATLLLVDLKRRIEVIIWLARLQFRCTELL